MRLECKTSHGKFSHFLLVRRPFAFQTSTLYTSHLFVDGMPPNHQSRSGTETPAIDKNLHDLDYVPPPDEYRPGIFGAILSSKLAALQSTGVTFPRFLDDNQSPPSDKYSPNGTQSKSHSRPTSGMHPYSTTSSGRATPSKRPKWYEKETFNQSTGSMATLLAQASITSAATAAPGASGVVPRPHLPRSKSSNSMIATAVDMIKHPGHVSLPL